MKRINWVWLLPIVQLAFAFSCLVYGPHQYRVRAQRDGAVNNPEYVFQHSPAVVERLSKGVNFPALVLAYPFRDEGNAIYWHNSKYTLIWIAPKDVSFFLGIALFWSWVGMRLNKSLGRGRKGVWPRKVRLAGLGCGVVFGLLTGAYALQMIASKWRPERQIGAFGILWAVALLAYFVWSVTREVRWGSSGSV
jgi:hypothetical protein